MASYLDVDGFTLRTIMPAADVARLDQNWLIQTLEDWSEEIDDRLRKRYAVPFASPCPKIVKH